MINAIILQIILLAFQALLYFGLQKFEGPAHDVSCSLDEKIPYRPYSIFVYILWFPMIFFFPLCLYYHARGLYTIYIISIIADILMSTAVYMIYPSTFERPKTPDGFIGWVMGIVYRCDYKGKNCMPSMHCSMCFIIIFAAAVSMDCCPPLYAGFLVLSVLIVISTLLTKQHVIIDVVTGLFAAAVSLGLGFLTGGIFF
ncbi:MAG: hypothetical protein ACI4LA_04305 [Emergencia sp.]